MAMPSYSVCKGVTIPFACLHMETPSMMGSPSRLIRQAQQNSPLTAFCCPGRARSSWVSLPLMHRDGTCPALYCLHSFWSLPPCRNTSTPPTQHGPGGGSAMDEVASRTKEGLVCFSCRTVHVRRGEAHISIHAPGI